MRESIQHPVYGEIIYNESFWVGKKTLTINGVDAQPISKKEFMIDGKKIVIKGSYLTGISLYIDNDTVEVSPKPKWYEVVLALLPIIFLLTWGNSTALCAIFPVIGGAIGGALGALGSITALSLIKKTKTPLIKALIGIGTFVATVLVAFALASALILLIA